MKQCGKCVFFAIRANPDAKAERERVIQRVNRSRGGTSHSAADHKQRTVLGRKGRGK